MRPSHLGKSLFLCLVAFFLVMLIAASALAEGPTGAGPNDPMMVPTDVQTIGPNTTLWFYFDYTPTSPGGGGLRRRSGPSVANVTLDANGVGGVSMAIFTPVQAKNWLSDPTTAPVGRGTPYRDTSSGNITHDLYWSGSFSTSGRYLIAVTNSNAGPVPFRLTVTGDTVILYPTPVGAGTPTLYIPITLTPIPTGTIQGKILFEDSTGGLIYTVNGDGTGLTQVAQGIDPAWSVDGKQITYSSWDNTDPGVFVANADGSNKHLVFGAPRTRWPRFSPDGKYIVFSQDKSKNDQNLSWKLGLVELATGHLTEPQCSKLCFVPSWAPDSVTVIYTDPDIGIQATNIFKGPASLVRGPSGFYWDTTANIPRPILHMPPIQDSEVSPDGQRIIYSQQAQDRWELNVVNADGSGQTGITGPDPILSILFDKVVHNVAPTWSPDGQQILFLSDRNGKWEFFTINPDGTNLRQVLKSVTDEVSLNFSYENERMVSWVR